MTGKLKARNIIEDVNAEIKNLVSNLQLNNVLDTSGRMGHRWNSYCHERTSKDIQGNIRKEEKDCKKHEFQRNVTNSKILKKKMKTFTCTVKYYFIQKTSSGLSAR